MKSLIPALLLLLATSAQAETQCPAWLRHDMNKLHSRQILNLCDLTHGKVALIVNTASDCGYTPQFKDLEKLYE